MLRFFHRDEIGWGAGGDVVEPGAVVVQDGGDTGIQFSRINLGLDDCHDFVKSQAVSVGTVLSKR